ncbi:hypothetical protein DPMN_194414 [Dreissena polymorpha]|uniref:Uncharacterized protein n=1 Tax=Dreissena polymorpha TaxID=45954 RepID=A0A9D3Y059_DREPO|nr:hypothetical protein DPMN_194414 [Dreissena polymorpha]
MITCTDGNVTSDITGTFKGIFSRFGGRGDPPYVQRHRQRRRCHVLHTSAGIHLFRSGSRN